MTSDDQGGERRESQREDACCTSVCVSSLPRFVSVMDALLMEEWVSASVVIYVPLKVSELILNHTNLEAVYTPLQIINSIQLTCIHDCLYIASAS
jgi:hypothetical protein